MNLHPLFTQKPSQSKNWLAGFSGVVMTVLKYGMLLAIDIASGSAEVFASDVRETKTLMSGQMAVSLY